MNDLVVTAEAMSGLRFKALLFVIAAGYFSCLVFPSINQGNTTLLALGIAGTWGLLFGAANVMGSWRAMLEPMANHGAVGIVLLLLTTGAVTVTVLAGLSEVGTIPVGMVFQPANSQ